MHGCDDGALRGLLNSAITRRMLQAQIDKIKKFPFVLPCAVQTATAANYNDESSEDSQGSLSYMMCGHID